MHSPVSGFHSFVVLSSEHEAITEPSLDMRAQRTQLVCPTNEDMNLSLSVAHSLIILSSDAVII